MTLTEKEIEEIKQLSSKIQQLKMEYLKLLNRGIDYDLILCVIQFDYSNRNSIVSMLFDDSYRQEIMDKIKIDTIEDLKNNLLSLFLANEEYILQKEKERKREKSYRLLIGDES